MFNHGVINTLPLSYDVVLTYYFLITWPKIFDFGQVLFSSACMCLCVCLCVSVFIDYFIKFLTDFDEIWQDGVE